MNGISRTTLLGNIGQDPEVKTFENGGKVARLNVAVNETWKDKEGKAIEHVEWYSVDCYRTLADIAEKYVKKGEKVYLEGILRTKSYTKDDEKRYICVIEATRLILLGGKNPEAVETVVVPTEDQRAETSPTLDQLSF
jgi:single-strand DNA-binding protein